MSRKHTIKLHTRYYNYVEAGIKNAEVRYNDRGYLTGDILELREWDGTKYTGRSVMRRAMGVFALDSIGFENWVLISMERIPCNGHQIR